MNGHMNINILTEYPEMEDVLRKEENIFEN